jgi:hypothetical protein
VLFLRAGTYFSGRNADSSMPKFCPACGAAAEDGIVLCSACSLLKSGKPLVPSDSRTQVQLSQHRAAVEAARKADQRVRLFIAGTAGLGVVALVFVVGQLFSSERSQPAPIIKDQNYDEVPSRTRPPTAVTVPAESAQAKTPEANLKQPVELTTQQPSIEEIKIDGTEC